MQRRRRKGKRMRRQSDDDELHKNYMIWVNSDMKMKKKELAKNLREFKIWQLKIGQSSNNLCFKNQQLDIFDSAYFEEESELLDFSNTKASLSSLHRTEASPDWFNGVASQDNTSS